MFISKLKIATVILLGVGAFTAGTGGFLYRSPGPGQAVAQEQRQVNVETKADAAKKQELPTLKFTVKAQLELAKARLQQAEIERLAAEARLAQAKAEYDLAQRGLEFALKATSAAQKQEPKKDSVEKPPPDEYAAKGLALTGGTQGDLIQLATAYIDAVRDLDTAKVHMKIPELTEEGPTLKRINLVAAERKVGLLKAIIEGSLKGAESELQRAREIHQRGYHPISQVTAAETKIRVLKLILDSAR
jgi:hypothetical protein